MPFPELTEFTACQQRPIEELPSLRALHDQRARDRRVRHYHKQGIRHFLTVVNKTRRVPIEKSSQPA
jgi:hypothetical protein